MTDPTNTDRQARFVANIRAKGYVKICEWIPAAKRDAFKALAKEWRGETPPPTNDETTARVRQAHAWGWQPAAIAAYTGCTAEQVQRILNRE